MEEKNIKSKDLLSIWWSFFWRYTVITIFLSSLSGAIGAYIVVKLGYPELADTIKTLLLLLTIIISSFLALKNTLSTKFNGYSISFVKN